MKHVQQPLKRQVRWVNEQRLVFGIADLSDGRGRPNGQSGLFAINPDGSDMRQLIRREGRSGGSRCG